MLAIFRKGPYNIFLREIRDFTELSSFFPAVSVKNLLHVIMNDL